MVGDTNGLVFGGVGVIGFVFLHFADTAAKGVIAVGPGLTLGIGDLSQLAIATPAVAPGLRTEAVALLRLFNQLPARVVAVGGVADLA